MPRPDAHRPSFPPSFTLHVSPSSGETHGNFSGDEYRSLEGYTLKEAIEDAYNVSAPRIQLPPDLDDGKRYNFAMVLPPEPGGQARLKTRFQHGIEEYFHLTARHESRLTDVYVVTADANHAPPPVIPQAGSGRGYIGGSNISFEIPHVSGEMPDLRKLLGIDAISGLSASGSIDEFCHLLESRLDRPVVNETNLRGQYVYNVNSDDGPQNNFLQHLHDQLGLTLTPGQRNVEMLIFDPH